MLNDTDNNLNDLQFLLLMIKMRLMMKSVPHKHVHRLMNQKLLTWFTDNDINFIWLIVRIATPNDIYQKWYHYVSIWIRDRDYYF